ADVAVGVVEVAEVHGVGDARRDAHGRVLGIHAGHGAGRRLVHAMLAEGALAHHPVAFGVARLLLRGRRRQEVPVLLVDHVTRAIGARDRAVAAADAHVVLDEDDAVLALLAGTGRAHRHARRLGAVLAAHRQEGAAHVGILADLHVHHVPPEDPRWQRVLLVTGDGARLAAHALADVDHHAPAHQDFPFAR